MLHQAIRNLDSRVVNLITSQDDTEVQYVSDSVGNELVLTITQAEIDAEVTRLQAEYDAQEYARNRVPEYPSLGDQLDMIYHAGLGGDEFQAAIAAVKDKYPKG